MGTLFPLPEKVDYANSEQTLHWRQAEKQYLKALKGIDELTESKYYQVKIPEKMETTKLKHVLGHFCPGAMHCSSRSNWEAEQCFWYLKTVEGESRSLVPPKCRGSGNPAFGLKSWGATP